jgi:hypothetical protein
MDRSGISGLVEMEVGYSSNLPPDTPRSKDGSDEVDEEFTQLKKDAM